MRFHEERFAAAYHARLKNEGYPADLLRFVLKELDSASNLIDVGGGSGFFAVPIAEAGISVTVVDPALPMTRILSETILTRGIQSITISNDTWENWIGPRHDAALAAHSLYPINDPVYAVKKMIESADLRLVIVRDDDGQRTLSDEIRAAFGSPRTLKNLGAAIESTVASCGISFNKKHIRSNKTQKIENLESEAEYYCYFLNLPDSMEDKIRVFLENKCTPQHGIYEYVSAQSDLIYVF